MRSQVEIEQMSMRFSSITVDDDETAQGVQTALRWVLYPEIDDTEVLSCLPR